MKAQALAVSPSSSIVDPFRRQETATQRARQTLFEQIQTLKDNGMTQKAVAANTGVRVKTVHRWLQAGGAPLPGRRPGLRQVITVAEQQWM